MISDAPAAPVAANSRKRPWVEGEENTRSKPSQGAGESSEDAVVGPRKRAVFLLVQYNGSGFSGLQFQFNVPSIEGELFRAACNIGVISEANSESLSKVNWQRAARTDKGVHAAMNLISFKCLLDDDSPEALKALVQKFNDLLPPQIRVFAIERTTNGFHAKLQCSSRSYEYILPSYCLDPKYAAVSHEDYQRRVDALARLNQQREIDYVQFILNEKDETAELTPAPLDDRGRRIKPARKAADSDSEGEGEVEAPKGRDPLPEPEPLSADFQQELCSYRISPDRLASVDLALSKFLGSHNYFNFTRAKGGDRDADEVLGIKQKRAEARRVYRERLAQNPETTMESVLTDMKMLPMRSATVLNERFKAARNRRMIHSFKVSEVFIHPTSGLEFLRFTVHGQSFMLNQIRKMMALVILLGRGTFPIDDIFPHVFNRAGFQIPIAPCEGLYLDQPFFEFYDKKVLTVAENQAAQRVGVAETVERNHQQTREFKKRFIWEEICSGERTKWTFYRWMEQINLSETLFEILVEREKAAKLNEEKKIQ